MKKLIAFIMFLTLTGLTAQSFADTPQSLQGIKTARIVVDLNQGNADTLKLRLDLLMETINDIEQSGVKTDVVVAVRGQASRFMTTDDTFIQPDEKQMKKAIKTDIDALIKRGARFEQCAIALRLMNIPAQSVSPALKVVQNGYVSLIGYQNRGYALLPME